MEKISNVTPDMLRKIVCDYTGVSFKELKSKKRNWNLVVARNYLIILMSKRLGLSDDFIADYLDRHRPSVVARKLDHFYRIRQDEEYVANLQKIEDILDVKIYGISIVSYKTLIKALEYLNEKTIITRR